jgi:hypothetical protein
MVMIDPTHNDEELFLQMIVTLIVQVVLNTEEKDEI